MTIDDLQADSLVNPTCFKVHIKSSKTDLFCMGCEAVIYMLGVVCPIHNLGDFLAFSTTFGAALGLGASRLGTR